MIAIHALGAIGEVTPGCDLSALLVDALRSEGIALRAGDVLVVTQKIVSKAEGRFAPLAGFVPGEEALRLAGITGKDPAFVQAVLAESREVIRAARNVLITRHRLGFAMANSGIDRSNLGPGHAGDLLLLPEDPDGSARSLRAAIERSVGVAPAIVISDSFGRPWRHGVTGVAIGAAGLPALLDRRGERDRDGRVLEVTQFALADVLATAAGLATGEGAEGIPAALIRGYAMPEGDRPAADLVRPAEEDLFR